MKKLKKILFILAILIVVGMASHFIYLTTLNATETYPDDSFLKNETNKTALIIVAHDDDAVSAAGTVCMLTENGWTVKQMCFYSGGGDEREQIRKSSIKEVAILEGLKEMKPVDCKYRIDTPEKGWMPISYSKFKECYLVDSVYKIVGDFIKSNQPSVIISLDDTIGAYGNPDHVMVSQAVTAYCKEHANDSIFSVKKIYQAVFPPSMGEKLMGRVPAYNEGKTIYACNGMPVPNVQIDISGVAAKKKAIMRSYPTEQKNLKKFWPSYHLYPASIYFKIFDREFFRVIDVQK